MNVLERPVPSDTAAIAGVVTDDVGEPLPWAIVSLGGASPQHRDIGAVTDDEGRYRFDRLEPGVYTVLVNAEGYPLQQKEVQAEADLLARLDFELQR
jgi:iron complex outermembrane receptor protein